MTSLLEPDRLLATYMAGVFPMADEHGELHWLAPDPRAIIELDQTKVSRSLRSTVRRGVYGITIDRAFERVIAACADRPDGTWISDSIKTAYCRLHELGFGHSIEAWRDGKLAGGLYGVSIGGAFFGESMFHRDTDASKVALVHLVTHMKKRGMILLDIQFMTEHLRQFGASDITRTEYERRLQKAVRMDCRFTDDAGQVLFQDDGQGA